MRQTTAAVLLILLSVTIPAFSAAKSPKPLQVFFIDVEGGQSTLIVSPLGESLLIDTGWAGSRDAERIVAAAKEAGLKRIDYVLITHYHVDHVGGVADLLQRMPVGTFVDHGSDVEDSDTAKAQYAAYEKAIEHAQRMHLAPNQGLPFKGMTVEVLAVAGEHLASPLPGAGEANPYCASEPEAQADASENAQSFGLLITLGRFRFLDLGDVTEKRSLDLVCPNNLIGTVDVYLTTHHGMAPDNPKSLVWAVHPRVAIMNNGAHKGGSPEAWQIVHDSPGLIDLWQLHYAADSAKDHNVADGMIANLDEASDGHEIRLAAGPDGAFTVTNSRNGVSRTYSQKQ
jgi:competence protein ComEC